MKKVFAISLLVVSVSLGTISSYASPKSPSANGTIVAENSAQVGQILFPKRRHHHWWGNGRVRYETVTVNKGRKVYRDTYKITYKNGWEKRKRVQHVRIA